MALSRAFSESRHLLLAVFAALFAAPPPLLAQDVAEIRIGYISQLSARPPNLSNLIQPPENEGRAGGELSVEDNNTTGRFVGQKFTFEPASIPIDADPGPAIEAMLADGPQFIVVDAPAETLLALADAAAELPVLIFNASAPDDRLRGADCRANVMHVAPSRAMLTDALAQYLVWKRWRRWFLIEGLRPGDALYADALRRSARKFGAEIVEEKVWAFGEDVRRTAQAEVPGFTQGDEHDVVAVADEIGVFGEYIMYRTWAPRPVAGTQGLTPSTWHLTHEQWGSAQLQSRFVETNDRRMTALDYQVWAAVRAIGEAATRAGAANFDAIEAWLKSDKFELAGFKGLPLTFRDWNWQLRQPILLNQPAALVSVSPQDGFLHQRSILDTMGLDKTESACDLAP